MVVVPVGNMHCVMGSHLHGYDLVLIGFHLCSIFHVGDSIYVLVLHGIYMDILCGYCMGILCAFHG